MIWKLIFNIIKSKKKKRLYKAFAKNKKQILAGLKNYVIKTKNIEIIAKYRMSICDECSSKSNDDIACVVPNTAPCCIECGCCLDLKVRSLSSSCPLNKWDEIISIEDEVKMLSKLIS